MAVERDYERAAESYLQALLRSHASPQEVVQELESTAAYLNQEGQADLARALRAVIARRLRPGNDQHA